MRLEHWFYTIPLRLRSVFRRSRMERELEKELQLHLTQRIEQGVAMGQPADEARYAALRAMEGIEQRKEECRDARRVHWLEDLLQDVCYAFRILAKAPGFTVVAALVLALGIGANTAVFTVVNGVLLQPLPFSEPSRLFLISAMPKNNPFIAPGPYMSDRDYLRFRRQDHAFESTATFGKEPVTLTGAGDPAVMNALAVTPDFLTVLGVRPSIGRAFLPEGRVDTNVVLLSNRLWHGRFSGDPMIVGKAITLVVQARNFSITMAAEIRSVLRRVDPELPTQSVTTMDDMIAETVPEVRSQSRLLGIFSIYCSLARGDWRLWSAGLRSGGAHA